MKVRLNPIIQRVRHVVKPPVTLGVRCLVCDVDRNVLLVRHTYLKGWHLPGGAVDPGETSREAALRETREETGVTVSAPLRFVGLFFNAGMAARDHVALFAALDHPAIGEDDLRAQAIEIADVCLASSDALPKDVTPQTRRRIAEVLSGSTPPERW